MCLYSSFQPLQKCKLWMLQHLVRSPSRTAAFGKYLIAFANAQPGDAKKDAAATKPSLKRRRLHLLYILNDAFFHVKNRTNDHALFAAIEPHLPALFKSAAAFADAPKHAKKLEDLIQLWQQKKYFSESLLDQLREAVTKGPSANGTESNGAVAVQAGTSIASSALSRDAPFLLPSMHGDASTPWYDLPAANWLPVIEPNSTRPMNPSMIKPLQLASGPAEKSLVQAVKKLLGDVDKIYAKEVQLDGDAAVVDISQMGEAIERDGMGEIIGGETYYGWSRAFCEKMKARRNGDAMDIDDNDDRRGRRDSSRSDSQSRSGSRQRLRGRGRSSSRSSSRPAMKRRRLSTSRSPSRDRSRSRKRSYSRRRSRSYSSRSRSRSPRRRSQNGRDSRSRSRSYSPPRAFGGPSNNNPPAKSQPHNAFVPPIPQQQQHFFNQPPPPPPPHFPGAPPPPPPNFAGGPGYMHPLPPHPPPAAHLTAHQPPNYNAWHVPPPPPPPVPQHYQQGQQWPPAPPPPPPGGLPQPTAQGWFPPPMPPTQPHVGWGGGWGPSPPSATGGPPAQSGFGYAANNQSNNNNNNSRGGGNSSGYQGRGGYGNGRGRGW